MILKPRNSCVFCSETATARAQGDDGDNDDTIALTCYISFSVGSLICEYIECHLDDIS